MRSLVLTLACVLVAGNVAGLVSSEHVARAYAKSPEVPGLKKRCGFRNSIWHIVQETAFDVKVARAYGTTDEVENDRAPLDEALDRAEWKYSFPRGWNYLQTTYGHAWGHLWDVGYWSSQFSQDLGSQYGDTSFDIRQENRAIQAAQASLGPLWSAANQVC